MLRFERNVLVSSLTPHLLPEYTLVMLLRQVPSAEPQGDQVILGVDPRAQNGEHFLVYTDETLRSGFVVETREGTARLALPRQLRGRPFVMALCKKNGIVSVYVNGDGIRLSGKKAAPSPPVDHDRFPGLQLGGLEDENRFFNGWIGELRFYERGLTPPEIRQISDRLLKTSVGAAP